MALTPEEQRRLDAMCDEPRTDDPHLARQLGKRRGPAVRRIRKAAWLALAAATVMVAIAVPLGSAVGSAVGWCAILAAGAALVLTTRP